LKIPFISAAYLKQDTAIRRPKFPFDNQG